MQTLADTNVTLRKLKQSLGLHFAQDSTFFAEWSDPQSSLSEADQGVLDRVMANFTALMEDPPPLENSVKVVVLAPLLDLAGFYQKPFCIETETSITVTMEDEGAVLRGRIDMLVLKHRLWLLAIESKRSDCAVTRAIPQAQAYLLANPTIPEPTFAMITNGNGFLFLKATRQPKVEPANSRLFSLVNPNNELYTVPQTLKCLGAVAIA